MRRLFFEFLFVFLFCFLFWGILENSLSAQSRRSEETFWDKQISMIVSGSPLREKLEDFVKIQKIGLLLDRRIDPSTPLDFEAQNVRGEELFELLAKDLNLGFCRVGSVAYFGPSQAVFQFKALQNDQRERLLKTHPNILRFFTQTISLKTERLETPQEILQKISQKYRFSITNRNRLPHDLWPELDWPEISLSDALLLLLIGFNATFEIQPASASPGFTVSIVPIPQNLVRLSEKHAISSSSSTVSHATESDAAVQETSSNRNNGNQSTPNRSTENTVSKNSAKKINKNEPLTKQRFQMVKIQNKTLSEVFDYLSNNVALNFEVDQESLQKKGVSLDQRISLSLDDANIHELLQAILEPVNASYQLQGRKVRVY